MFVVFDKCKLKIWLSLYIEATERDRLGVTSILFFSTFTLIRTNTEYFNSVFQSIS